jgi:putative PIN family toxin of toxin-antitoxin system
MNRMKSIFSTVPDTNVILSAHLSKNSSSPNSEYLRLWVDDKFEILYSEDTLEEYVEKLLEKHVPISLIERFISQMSHKGVRISIDKFHVPPFPTDPDDIAFLLCAENGNATHLITHDAHLLDNNVGFYRTFKICRIIPFLHELRENAL